jgi:fructokinase
VSNPKILCLGEILFDLLADRPTELISEVQSWTPYAGGAPANVACALAKLGIPTALITCMGTDESEQELIKLLIRLEINITGIQNNAEFPTRQVYVLRSPTGERIFAGFGERGVDDFADTRIDPDKLPLELFLDAEFLVIGTLGLAYPQTRSAIFRALELAERYSLKVVVDVNWRSMFWPNPQAAPNLIAQLWPYVDFVKLSVEEAQWLFKTSDAGTIARYLDSVEGVLVTAGKEGNVSYYLNELEGEVSPFEVKVEDTTGAGDAFLAGFLACLCRYGIASLNNPTIARKIITYACAVGALTTTKCGAIDSQPTFVEVEKFIAANC